MPQPAGGLPTMVVHPLPQSSQTESQQNALEPRYQSAALSLQRQCNGVGHASARGNEQEQTGAFGGSGTSDARHQCRSDDTQTTSTKGSLYSKACITVNGVVKSLFIPLEPTSCASSNYVHRDSLNTMACSQSTETRSPSVITDSAGSYIGGSSDQPSAEPIAMTYPVNINPVIVSQSLNDHQGNRTSQTTPDKRNKPKIKTSAQSSATGLKAVNIGQSKSKSKQIKSKTLAQNNRGILKCKNSISSQESTESTLDVQTNNIDHASSLTSARRALQDALQHTSPLSTSSSSGLSSSKRTMDTGITLSKTCGVMLPSAPPNNFQARLPAKVKIYCVRRKATAALPQYSASKTNLPEVVRSDMWPNRTCNELFQPAPNSFSGSSRSGLTSPTHYCPYNSPVAPYDNDDSDSQRTIPYSEHSSPEQLNTENNSMDLSSIESSPSVSQADYENAFSISAGSRSSTNPSSQLQRILALRPKPQQKLSTITLPKTTPLLSPHLTAHEENSSDVTSNSSQVYHPGFYSPLLQDHLTNCQNDNRANSHNMLGTALSQEEAAAVQESGPSCNEIWQQLANHHSWMFDYNHKQGHPAGTHSAMYSDKSHEQVSSSNVSSSYDSSYPDLKERLVETVDAIPERSDPYLDWGESPYVPPSIDTEVATNSQDEKYDLFSPNGQSLKISSVFSLSTTHQMPHDDMLSGCDYSKSINNSDMNNSVVSEASTISADGSFLYGNDSPGYLCGCISSMINPDVPIDLSKGSRDLRDSCQYGCQTKSPLIGNGYERLYHPDPYTDLKEAGSSEFTAADLPLDLCKPRQLEPLDLSMQPRKSNSDECTVAPEEKHSDLNSTGCPMPSSNVNEDKKSASSKSEQVKVCIERLSATLKTKQLYTILSNICKKEQRPQNPVPSTLKVTVVKDNTLEHKPPTSPNEEPTDISTRGTDIDVVAVKNYEIPRLPSEQNLQKPDTTKHLDGGQFVATPSVQADIKTIENHSKSDGHVPLLKTKNPNQQDTENVPGEEESCGMSAESCGDPSLTLSVSCMLATNNSASETTHPSFTQTVATKQYGLPKGILSGSVAKPCSQKGNTLITDPTMQPTDIAENTSSQQHMPSPFKVNELSLTVNTGQNFDTLENQETMSVIKKGNKGILQNETPKPRTSAVCKTPESKVSLTVSDAANQYLFKNNQTERTVNEHLISTIPYGYKTSDTQSTIAYSMGDDELIPKENILDPVEKVAGPTASEFPSIISRPIREWQRFHPEYFQCRVILPKVSAIDSRYNVCLKAAIAQQTMSRDAVVEQTLPPVKQAMNTVTEACISKESMNDHYPNTFARKQSSIKNNTIISNDNPGIIKVFSELTTNVKRKTKQTARKSTTKPVYLHLAKKSTTKRARGLAFNASNIASGKIHVETNALAQPSTVTDPILKSITKSVKREKNQSSKSNLLELKQEGSHSSKENPGLPAEISDREKITGAEPEQRADTSLKKTKSKAKKQPAQENSKFGSRKLDNMRDNSTECIPELCGLGTAHDISNGDNNRAARKKQKDIIGKNRGKSFSTYNTAKEKFKEKSQRERYSVKNGPAESPKPYNININKDPPDTVGHSESVLRAIKILAKTKENAALDESCNQPRTDVCQCKHKSEDEETKGNKGYPSFYDYQMSKLNKTLKVSPNPTVRQVTPACLQSAPTSGMKQLRKIASNHMQNYTMQQQAHITSSSNCVPSRNIPVHQPCMEVNEFKCRNKPRCSVGPSRQLPPVSSFDNCCYQAQMMCKEGRAAYSNKMRVTNHLPNYNNITSQTALVVPNTVGRVYIRPSIPQNRLSRCSIESGRHLSDYVAQRKQSTIRTAELGKWTLPISSGYVRVQRPDPGKEIRHAVQPRVCDTASLNTRKRKFVNEEWHSPGNQTVNGISNSLGVKHACSRPLVTATKPQNEPSKCSMRTVSNVSRKGETSPAQKNYIIDWKVGSNNFNSHKANIESGRRASRQTIAIESIHPTRVKRLQKDVAKSNKNRIKALQHGLKQQEALLRSLKEDIHRQHTDLKRL